MKEEFLALKTFNNDGDASAAVGKMSTLTDQYADLLSRRKKLGDGADQVNEELTAEIEKLSGELVKLP